MHDSREYVCGFYLETQHPGQARVRVFHRSQKKKNACYVLVVVGSFDALIDPVINQADARQARSFTRSSRTSLFLKRGKSFAYSID
jgi:hypothetical protein